MAPGGLLLAACRDIIEKRDLGRIQGGMGRDQREERDLREDRWRRGKRSERRERFRENLRRHE